MAQTQKTICDKLDTISGIQAVLKGDRGITTIKAKKEDWPAIIQTINQEFKRYVHTFSDNILTVHSYIVKLEDAE